MGVTRIASNSICSVPLSKRFAGPPFYILSLAVALEMIFWAFDIQQQFMEVWVVALLVPLAMSLTKPKEDANGKRAAKDG